MWWLRLLAIVIEYRLIVCSREFYIYADDILSLIFHPRSRPVLWLARVLNLGKNTGYFVVYLPKTSVQASPLTETLTIN